MPFGSEIYPQLTQAIQSLSVGTEYPARDTLEQKLGSLPPYNYNSWFKKMACISPIRHAEEGDSLYLYFKRKFDPRVGDETDRKMARAICSRCRAKDYCVIYQAAKSNS